MKKIGIECENLEGERFGVGHMTAQLLDALTKVPNIEKKYKFILYFKKEIPKDSFLNHQVFEKKIINDGILPTSFNIYYHILLPFYYIKDKLDLFFFPSYMLPAFFPPSKKAIVVLTNDVWWEAHHGSLPFRYRLSYKLFCKWAALRAKKIMTISDFSKKELMKFYNLPDKKIFTNYWGLSSEFKELKKDEESLKKIKEIKEKLGIKKDYIMSVGQAFERRRVKEAMEAFGKVAKDFPDLQYFVPCADKNNPPVLDELAEKINKELGREAVIRGKYINREDMLYLFNFTKLLIYVSDKEALGLPPVEALACGAPSLVADNGLTREIFKDNAFFVKNTKNIDEFSEKIKKALTDSQKREDIRKNKEEILEKLSWKKHTETLLEVFNKIS